MAAANRHFRVPRCCEGSVTNGLLAATVMQDPLPKGPAVTAVQDLSLRVSW